MQNWAILAATSKFADIWKSKIQSLYSVDKHCDVDNSHNTLRSMLTEEELNNLDDSGYPRHVLYLKVNKIGMFFETKQDSRTNQ